MRTVQIGEDRCGKDDESRVRVILSSVRHLGQSPEERIAEKEARVRRCVEKETIVRVKKSSGEGTEII